jgi:hypothetical protein
MGCCDIITLDREYAEYGIARGTIFQSKSLHAGDGQFTITADGKLIEHLGRYETDTERGDNFTQQPVYRRVYVGDQIIEYHGDILLYGPPRNKRSGELVARFTHGRLEWIRHVDEYPESNHAFLVAQGAR